MKILHVYKDYYPPVKGGIECHINLLARGLKDRGVSVRVLVSNRTNTFLTDNFDGIEVAKVPQWGRFYSAPLSPTFRSYLKRFGQAADIIHFHHPNPTAEFAYLFTNLNKKMIVTYHSDIIRQDKLGKLYSPFRQIFLEKSNRIIATSANYIHSSNVLKNFKDKCRVIPLGIDIERFSNPRDVLAAEQIRDANHDLPLILFVGCFRYYKGLHLLISAMRGIQARLLLIGSGPEEQRLRQQVRRNHLDEKIHFLGELSDEKVNAYYQACDIFVLPSHLRSEAFGMVQLEAMCCQKPVISTELGTGTSFVNIDQQSGITVRPNDIQALNRAIKYLVDNRDVRKAFGTFGQQRVRKRFSAEQMVESTLRLYESVINGDAVTTNAIKPKRKARAVNRPRQLRILRIVSRLNIGGPSIHVKNLTEGLDKSRFATKLITGTVSPNEGDMSYITNFDRHVRIEIPEMQREIAPFNDMLALLKVVKTIGRFRPHIVHSHMSKAGTITRLAALVYNLFNQHKIIVVHTFHGHVLDGYFNKSTSLMFRLIERFLAKLTDRIIAISDTQKCELSMIYKVDRPKKIATIKLGFDLAPFLSCSRDGDQFRKKIGVAEDTILIGIVGRLAPIKNHRMFIDAAKMLLDKATDKKIKFILIGDGEERRPLEAYVKDNGIAKQVIFHGWEKNICEVYQALDVLALTSINEGTPVSVIEAMAASVPVVTTGVGGIKDLLGSVQVERPRCANFDICQRGIRCPTDEPTAFCEALNYAIRSDYLLDGSRLTHAKDYVIKNYSMARLVKDIESLYEELIDSQD